MKRLKTLFEIIKILWSGDNVGDVAVLKLSLFSRSEGLLPTSEAARKMKETNFKAIEIEELALYPAGSFGRAYFEFMKRHRLKPFNFSDRVESYYENYPIAIRYARIHDMVHVLLGFEADFEGELGVYAFVGA